VCTICRSTSVPVAGNPLCWPRGDQLIVGVGDEMARLVPWTADATCSPGYDRRQDFFGKRTLSRIERRATAPARQVLEAGDVAPRPGYLLFDRREPECHGMDTE